MANNTRSLPAPHGNHNAVLRADWHTYSGLFLVTAGTLMQEVLLTRIFSVTMWYDLAFLAVSLAMFGMTIGALTVYLQPKKFSGPGRQERIATAAFLFAITAVLSILVHLNIPVRMSFSLAGVVSLTFNYLLMSLPFYFSGICVCAVLTALPQRAGRLYAADLSGAALGCLGVLAGLNFGGVGGTVFAIGVLGAGATLLFSSDARLHQTRRGSIVLGAVLLLLVVANGVSARWDRPLIRLRWAKGMLESRPLFEKWNSFSRVAVWGNPDRPDLPSSEGLSPTYTFPHLLHVLAIAIDEDASTPLIGFHGNWKELNYLKYNVKDLCYRMRPRGSAFIIGAGGGQDVLAALLYKEKSIRAVEVNPSILDALLKRFADFTGHIDRYPGVKFVNAEGRSYLAGHPRQKYDVIEASFVDTWAATAAGAFTLTENSLYTVQAWKLFLSRLTPHGVLSFSRWYVPGTPGEAYRLASLAATALRARGVQDPRNHILMVASPPRDDVPGAATILVSPSPFSPSDIARIDEVARKLRFAILLSPGSAADPVFAELATGDSWDPPASSLPLKLAPPTDDSPFFFNLVSFRDALRESMKADPGTASFNVQAVLVLELLLAIVAVLTLACVFLPLLRASGKGTLAGAAPHLIFFAAIGLGFMLVEVSAVERLIVLLGSPTYALSVVLLVLLLASALGSYFTRLLKLRYCRWVAALCLGVLPAILALFAWLSPQLVVDFAGTGAAVRVAVTTGWLFPVGFCMGMAFPLGFRLAAERSSELTAWLWGINGAASVLGSVLAIVIAMAATISATLWAGVGCYCVAALVFAAAMVRVPLPRKATPAGKGVPTAVFGLAPGRSMSDAPIMGFNVAEQRRRFGVPPDAIFFSEEK
jgi:hypothetical protein